MQLRDWLSWEKPPAPKAAPPVNKYRPLRDWLELNQANQEQKPPPAKRRVDNLPDQVGNH